MVLVAGLRDGTVGTDSWTYIYFFERITTFEDVCVVGAETWEYGYWFLNWLVHFISDSYIVLFFVIALIVVGCYQRAIVAYSANIGISFFVFMTMGFYTFFFNAARQGIACSICALALGPFLDRNFKKYLGYILLAFLFHKSAIIMLPIYFINKKNNFKFNALIGLFGCINALFLQTIVEFSSKIDNRYESYALPGQGGGRVSLAFLCVLCVFFWGCKKLIKIHVEHYSLLLNMFLFGTVLSVAPTLLGFNPSGILRLNIYFTISAVFLFPIVFSNFVKLSNRVVFSVFLVIGYLAYFTLSIQAFGDVVPYNFNSLLL